MFKWKQKKNVGLGNVGIGLEDKSQASAPVKGIIKPVSEQPLFSKTRKKVFFFKMRNAKEHQNFLFTLII